MNMAKIIAASFKVDEGLWLEFRDACKPFTASAILRVLIQKFISGEIEVKLN